MRPIDDLLHDLRDWPNGMAYPLSSSDEFRLRKILGEAETAIRHIQKQCATLEKWKAEQLEVEKSLNVQEVGRAIGVPLGGRIHPEILPAIERLKDTLKYYREWLDEWGNVTSVCLNNGMPFNPHESDAVSVKRFVSELLFQRRNAAAWCGALFAANGNGPYQPEDLYLPPQGDAMSDIVERLKASVGFGAVHGDSTERNVCEHQMTEAAREIERLREQVAGLERERDELRARLASQPQWRDRPTEAGKWLSSRRLVIAISESGVEDFPRILNTRWYGPIPADTNEKGE